MGGIFGKTRTSKTNTSKNGGPVRNGHVSSADYSTVSRYAVTPFVFKRWSSMYVDEDGDVAHEFFTENCQDHGRTMRKVDSALLSRQGYIDYDIPRLHPGIPYILVESKLL